MSALRPCQQLGDSYVCNTLIFIVEGNDYAGVVRPQHLYPIYYANANLLLLYDRNSQYQMIICTYAPSYCNKMLRSCSH